MRLAVAAARLPLPAASVPAPPATSTVTAPCAVGTIVIVQDVPVPETDVTVAFDAAISPRSTPVTLSVKDNASTNGDAFQDPLLGFKVDIGAVLSDTVLEFAANVVLPARSVAAPAERTTETTPSALGTTNKL